MNEPTSALSSAAASPASSNRMLLDWAKELQALAQTGLVYNHDSFDRERYERIRDIAIDMLAMQSDMPAERIRGLISAGYPTPKLDTRAAIFDADGRILLTHENSGEWSLPGGWVDEDQSVRSNTIKEVKEETGLNVTADQLIAVHDCANHNGLSFPYGVIKFFVQCTRIDGQFEPNIETTEIRYFAEDQLPQLSTTRNTAEQIAMCFTAHRDPDWATLFE
ncbi:NUDIX hydrolase N-terminal domain-containing protein [Bifidobacterium leontopitheci]|uniref:ADP-ribose pyrophosphatase n=1 Tax=Bifidobacterium leontopitheci TaxID=2650774 RepID=A0A6I1GKI0_9BIFI|nr:NUDIX hydrolase [Bifidobacterium leontopitheci]KAB7791282.1 ADP-ribose pyrophosphatase [Bifidobacterium leontopitheci]